MIPSEEMKCSKNNVSPENGPGQVCKTSQNMRCHARGPVPVHPGCPGLGRALPGSLAWRAPGEGFSVSHVLRMHRGLPQCSHTTPEGHLLGSVSRGCLGQVNVLDVQVHWGHQGGEADNAGCQKGFLLQKFFPTDGRARTWVCLPQRPHSCHGLNGLLQPLHWYREHSPLCFPSLL